jgi:hypothetical protein
MTRHVIWIKGSSFNDVTCLMLLDFKNVTLEAIQYGVNWLWRTQNFSGEKMSAEQWAHYSLTADLRRRSVFWDETSAANLESVGHDYWRPEELCTFLRYSWLVWCTELPVETLQTNGMDFYKQTDNFNQQYEGFTAVAILMFVLFSNSVTIVYNNLHVFAIFWMPTDVLLSSFTSLCNGYIYR